MLASRTAGSRYERFELHGKGVSAYIRAPELAEIHRQKEGVETVTGEQLTGSINPRITYGYLDENRHFIACILNDQTPLTNFTDAAKTMELVERIEAFGGMGKCSKITHAIGFSRCACKRAGVQACMSARVCGVSSKECKKFCPIHATGFSQWLMTDFLSAESFGVWEGEP